ncbi:DNA transposase THAP9like, partial [Caligus rogercresseyi]
MELHRKVLSNSRTRWFKSWNKTEKDHMEWRKMKMKVNLACQTLSRSVADAPEMLSKDLKVEDFSNCDAT